MPSSKSRKNEKRASRKAWLWSALLLIVGVALIGLYLVFAPNTGAFTKGDYLYIRTGSGYEQVKKSLQEGGYIRSMQTFDLLAKQAGYPDKVKAGKYKLHKGMSNYALIKLLGSGKQEPVRLVINKLRTKADFIRLVGTQLEADSNKLSALLSDPAYVSQFDVDTATVMCAVIPDTYEFYWNTSADKAFRKIQKSWPRFWTDARIAKAKAKNLTPVQATIMASIVEEEFARKDERGTIASVYLNRLSKGMKLQADPTAKFASGDFALRRITSAQTSLASPYNTYYVSGLPIGPICTPQPSTIDAVLNAPGTDYLYFTARTDGSGYHNFTATYGDHLKNADRYHELLNKRNIH